MPISPLRSLLIIFFTAAVTFITRALPFVLFPKNKKIPPVVKYLGRMLPPAVIGMLAVYCFKSVSISSFPFGIPEIIASLTVIVLHVWKRNNLISIGAGTVIYMVLIQFVFI